MLLDGRNKMSERRGRKAGQAWYLAMFQGTELALQMLTGGPVRFLSFVTTEVWPGKEGQESQKLRRFMIDATFTSDTPYGGAAQRITSPGLPLLADPGSNIWRIRGFDGALRLYCSEPVHVSCLGLVREWSLDTYFTYRGSSPPFVEVRTCDVGREQILGLWHTGHDLRDRAIQNRDYQPVQPRRVLYSL